MEDATTLLACDLSSFHDESQVWLPKRLPKKNPHIKWGLFLGRHSIDEVGPNQGRADSLCRVYSGLKEWAVYLC